MTLRELASRLVYSETVQGTRAGYRFALKRRYGAGRPLGYPQAPWRNAVLKTRLEWEAATAQVKVLGLPSYDNASKNWDALAALACTLEHSRASAPILDAGTTWDSMILPWLFLYGYRNLFGIGLEFDRTWKRGSIRYEPGDVTATRFGANTFEVVVCQSVLEHGVDMPDYLEEMARILRPGGLLITSVDYYDEPVVTHGVTPYGLPYRVFTRVAVDEFLTRARSFGLRLTGPIDLTCQDRAVIWDWEGYRLEYTYLLLTLSKGP